MKFLKLKFEHARLMVEKPKSNMLGTNRFFHPINKLHVYNSVCVLFDRTPTPQLRDVDNAFMPFYDDILSVVEKGYIKINSISEPEVNTIIKKPWDSKLTSHTPQYSWKDCRYVTGNLFPIFINHVSKILNITEEVLMKKAFDDVISEIQSMGVKNSKDEVVYDNDTINDLILWCKTNSSTIISNYMENKQISTKSFGFGKRVYRGVVQSNKYGGLIYIPLNNELFTELINYTKGFATILDGGLVTIIGYEEIFEDDIDGFVEINSLNGVRKFDKVTNGVKWDNTIYKDLDESNLESSMRKIIARCDISIKNNQEEYDSMMEKVSKLKKTKDVAYKLNHFIESSINKQYK